MGSGSALRADARRNRARVLAVAAEVFAAEGLSVPVQEIARRAGVGTGTVSRHFPTKQDLFEAILRDRVAELTGLADTLTQQLDPGGAFAAFFAAVVHAGAADLGFAERLAAGNLDTLGERVGVGVLCERLGQLLGRAQQAGAVRRDITLPDVEALMVACMTRGASLRTLIAVIDTGLRSPAGAVEEQPIPETKDAGP